MYTDFRKLFTANRAFITDTGSSLETDQFFDLCIADILRYKKFVPEMEEWFIKRKLKIKNAENYEEKIRLLEEFLENYQILFEKPRKTEIKNILENNPTS